MAKNLVSRFRDRAI